MKTSRSDQILEARMAFDAGDTRRGSSILHGILQADITYTPAWKLLHGALNRTESLEDFQLDFVLKYYPDRIDQFRSETARGEGEDGKNGPYRRVSLVAAAPATPPPERKTGRLIETNRPGSGPVSTARQGEPGPEADAETRAGPKRPAVKRPRQAPADSQRGGFFSRIRNFFSRFGRSGRKSAGAAGSGERPADDDHSAADSKFAPISLQDLPKKAAPEQPARERRRQRDETGPMLTKLREEQFEIRLLIADDIPQTRENIRKLLRFEPSVEVVGVAANGEEAIEMALEHTPDIVLMDINMPGMDGLQALKTIRDRLPLTQVIMLTVQDDPGYLREALQFGARDYLIKPPTIDELLQTIHKTHEIGKMERERLTRIFSPPVDEVEEEVVDANGFAVAVYSPKGGVGCTLLAANLAVAAQNGNRPVVLVDCDLQYGGVGLFFNEQARSSIADLAPRINDLDRALLQDAVITHPVSGVRLVLAPLRPEHAERVRASQLADLIRYLRKVYPVVVIDTGSSLDGHMAEVLAVCDHVVVVTTQDIPAIHEIRQFLDYAPKIGVGDEKISLVVNQYHKRINITSEQISKNLRRPLAAIVPLDNRTVIPSINRGVPFMINQENRALPIGAAVQLLVDHVLERQAVAV